MDTDLKNKSFLVGLKGTCLGTKVGSFEVVEKSSRKNLHDPVKKVLLEIVLFKKVRTGNGKVV